MDWAGSIYSILERFLFKQKNAHENWDKPFEMVQKYEHRKLLIIKEKCRLEIPLRKAGPKEANLDISCFWNSPSMGLALFTLLSPLMKFQWAGTACILRKHSKDFLPCPPTHRHLLLRMRVYFIPLKLQKSWLAFTWVVFQVIHNLQRGREWKNRTKNRR